ncbi:MAG TPA: hypothetical protein VGD49_01080 [Longimicrobiales bacterium]
MKTKLLTPLVLLMSAGCSTMRPVESPSAFLVGKSPGVVVVIAQDGRATEIASPKLLADTVYGFNAEGDEVTVAVGSVQTMFAKQINVPRTALLGAAAAVATYFLATAVFGSGEDPMIPPPEGEPEDFRSRQRLRPATRIPLIRIGIPF